MRPRPADSRIGHFTVRNHDFTTDAAKFPRQYFVNRWRLEKKDPQAALSEPRQPIVFWLDRNIPAKYRETVTAGVLEDMERLARGAEPWFIFAHYFDPHYDYIPPPPYDTRFDPTYTGTISGADFLGNPRLVVLDEVVSPLPGSTVSEGAFELRYKDFAAEGLKSGIGIGLTPRWTNRVVHSQEPGANPMLNFTAP